MPMRMRFWVALAVLGTAGVVLVDMKTVPFGGCVLAPSTAAKIGQVRRWVASTSFWTTVLEKVFDHTSNALIQNDRRYRWPLWSNRACPWSHPGDLDRVGVEGVPPA